MYKQILADEPELLGGSAVWTVTKQHSSELTRPTWQRRRHGGCERVQGGTAPAQTRRRCRGSGNRHRSPTPAVATHCRSSARTGAIRNIFYKSGPIVETSSGGMVPGCMLCVMTRASKATRLLVTLHGIFRPNHRRKGKFQVAGEDPYLQCSESSWHDTIAA